MIEKKKLPIGEEFFRNIRTKGFYYVDKTGFISELLKTRGSVNLFTRPRFSPGYGDLPLTVQKDFFRVLDCTRKIGLSLNDSLLMSPS